MGFEPTVLQRRTTVFKTVTIGHSDTPPGFKLYRRLYFQSNFADIIPIGFNQREEIPHIRRATYCGIKAIGIAN